MRGYGNLVGEVQSGHIKEVGVELYQSMLEESVKELRLADQSQQTAEPPPPVPQINLHTSVLIPESYVQDFDLRLSLYRRASELTDAHEVTALGAEMVDRFGSIPIEAEYLLSTIKLKLLCMKWRITKLDASPNGIVLSFAQDVNPDVPLQLINALKGLVKVRPDNKLLIQKAISNPTQRITYLEMLLHNPQE
jgi:transcription-repair coupling factor (superfamily II helicase)